MICNYKSMEKTYLLFKQHKQWNLKCVCLFKVNYFWQPWQSTPKILLLFSKFFSFIVTWKKLLPCDTVRFMHNKKHDPNDDLTLQ